jgi:hypothetical protein
MEAALDVILSSPDAAQVARTLACLHTIASNILAAPGEEKYRKLRTSNAAVQQRLLGTPSGEPFLLSLGFRRVGDELVLPAGVAVPRGVTFRLEAAMRAPMAFPPIPAPTPGGRTTITIYAYSLGEAPSEEVKLAAQLEFHSKNRRGLRGADNPCPSVGVGMRLRLL